MSVLPTASTAWFYRTAAGAEIDMVIEKGSKSRIAIEIKRSASPGVSKGFHIGCEDIKATHKYVVYPGNDKFPLGDNITVVPLKEMMDIVSQQK